MAYFVMAFFSEDLFEIFEEKSEPVSLTGKKRKDQTPKETARATRRRAK